MRELIDRLTRIGIPEKTALCIANDFELRGRLDALKAYALRMEEEYDGN